MSLEPIEPDTALELYLADGDNELADASLKAHKYRLGHFIRWYDQQDIENLNNLSGRVKAMPEKDELPFYDGHEHDMMTEEERVEMYQAWAGTGGISGRGRNPASDCYPLSLYDTWASTDTGYAWVTPEVYMRVCSGR